MRVSPFLLAARVVCTAFALILATTFIQQSAHGQAISMTGGSIQGTVTDPNGAILQGAKITIASEETGYSKALTSDSAGFYSLGPLNPGRYTITVDAPGFQQMVVKTTVSVGVVSSGNVKLQVGGSGVTIEVSAGDVQINTEQIGVAGTVSQEQIDTLPINGRNILDIAQIQPGVVLQSGQSFDPTKTGYSAIGVNGQNGRTTRILLDGQDISDETVGTLLFNVPSGGIGEFQLNRSTQDVSGEVTSTGQVLMVSKSGSNRFHGNAFYLFQDARAGFAGINGESGDAAPFQRNQFGGYVGGPILKDRLFFFGGAERNKQMDQSPVGVPNEFFTDIYNRWPQVPDPFKDTTSIGRLDWAGPWGVHFFARAAYSNNAGFGSGQPPYGVFQNQDNVPSLVGGADFTTHNVTHSVRFGYLKFINNINNGTEQLGNSIYNPSTALGVPFELYGSLDAGGNYLSPQNTYQSSKSFRYDGTWTKGGHNIKFGGEISRILEGGFAAFFDTMLSRVETSVSSTELAQCASSNPIGGIDGNGQCLGDPMYGWKNYEFILGNGNGSFSEKPGFGLPGGAFQSWRLASYVGDTWKVRPYLTLVAGVRWSVDTDRANQDLPTVTCGQVDADLQFDGCDSAHASTPLFDFFGPGLGLGKRTNQPWANLGPQAGFAFSPGAHKYVIRGGAGIFYESNLFNNQSNARAQNTPAEFPGFADGAIHYYNQTLSLPGYAIGIQGLSSGGDPCTPGTDADCKSWANIFNMSVADATLLVSKLDAKYKTASAKPQPNTSFIGFANGDALQAMSAYAGPYKTPYSIQLNAGVQYELRQGLVVNVDYIHNATLRVPLTVDTNHTGAARTLNKAAAANAIAATLDACGADSIDGAIANGCTIDDFAANGLTDGNEYLGGYPASAYGIPAEFGSAFPGTNTNVGAGNFILPEGKSAYDALQVVLQQQNQHPLPGIVSSNAQISYNFSKVTTNSKGGSNQFFGGYGAWNNDCTSCIMGRNGQDYTQMLSLATSFTVKYGPQISLVGHFFSAAPSDLTTPTSGITPTGGETTAAGIFKSDLNGDGTTGDLMPGTDPGDYMHRIKGKGLGRLIDNWNSHYAGKVTPAGQALIDAGLITADQLYKLGGVTQQLLPLQSKTPIQNPATRTFDAAFRYPIGYLKRFREGLVLTPSVTVYNAFNMANYGAFSGLADTTTSQDSLQASGYLNGYNDIPHLYQNRTLRGTGNGTYDQGGPRTMEFSLRLDF
ncbi:TonB-dependent receptor [Occallatibacter riparius]|uniref:Carboxypeptidase regulatory-like domain-containing protein n=1 Tax=Occallatibacter riparius TaxID=1002689 RepID=A0A9J7BWP3_9BACT|nr:carboxypeptidase regulatory-like domain-containing protein [Occallatibacter riparius]UWZ85445.1 carboxypeptidase regulatory-like domain-containing protein [Occallatibacter riparius]